MKVIRASPVCGRSAVFALLLLTAGLSCAQESAGRQSNPMTIVELQAGRKSETGMVAGPSGHQARATLVNLNPAINASFVFTLQSPDRRETLSYHIGNPAPTSQRLSLNPSNPGQLSIDAGDRTVECPMWPGDALEKARHSQLAFAPLCGGRLYLLNAVRGNRSALEATTEFLRDHVWRGEQIVGFVRREFFQDAFVERAGSPVDGAPLEGARVSDNGPLPARMMTEQVQQPVRAPGLGIDVGPHGGLLQGQWVAAAGLDGIHVSVVQPGAAAQGETLAAGRGRSLDPVESSALAYLVAFDLSAFEVGFALGTEHPRLGWSDRVRGEFRNAQIPGPDGIASASPLERTGRVAPEFQSRVVATFTGGFKREHGAFRHGPLASVNAGSHYGFVEQGVVFSRLVPGLSTLYVLEDDSVGMKTWTKEDDRLIRRIRHARQNGVPLIERDPDGGPSIFGALVDAWGPGNWSGSADEKLRTLRAGACLIEHAGRRFLVYGYFSTATPRAMARVFQAYGCSYAMHLDMNALEHTYLALYRTRDGRIGVEHLIAGMSVLDKRSGTSLLPRFLGFSDDRDFFYLMSRKGRR